MPLLGFSGCGYHTLGAATHLPPDVRTLSVPVFATQTETYRSETVMTQAVIREFATRTRMRVTPDASADADAVLHGTILKETVAPLTYNTSTQQSSSFLITMVVSVTLTGRDGKVLYENKNYVFRAAVPVHHRSAELLAGKPGGRRAALARICAAVGGRCAGRVLEGRVRDRDQASAALVGAPGRVFWNRMLRLSFAALNPIAPGTRYSGDRMMSDAGFNCAETAPVSGARWGAGFAAAGRFVAEIEAAAAGKGHAQARLRAGWRRGISAWTAAAAPF